MLVITRKPGESFKIGGDITVTVLGDRPGRVRLGIDAPVQVPVLRAELLDRVPTSAPRTSVDARGPSGRPPPAG